MIWMHRPKTFLCAVLLVVSLAVGTVASTRPAAADDWVLDAEAEARYARFQDLGEKVRGGDITAHWLPDGEGFWYVTGPPHDSEILRVDLTETPVRARPFFDVERLRRVVGGELGYEPPGRGVPFRDFVVEAVSAGEEHGADGAHVRFQVDGRYFRLGLGDYRLTRLPTPSAAETARTTPQPARAPRYAGEPPVFEVLSPDGRWWAGLTGGTNEVAKSEDAGGADLALRSTVDGRSRQLTHDGDQPDLRWDVEAARWSPDGVVLAATRQNLEGVHRVPLVHWLQPREQVEWVPFPKAGDQLPRQEVFLVDILSGEQTRVDDGCRTPCYLYPVAWMREGRELLILRMSRTFDRLDLLAADRATGATRVVLTETSDTFVEGLAFLYTWSHFVTPLADGERFLWLSERDGFHHLYLYDLDGHLLRRLTHGAFPVQAVQAVDEAAGTVYVLAQSDPARPYDLHLARVDLDAAEPVENQLGAGWRQLTAAPGQHRVQLSPSKMVFLDTYSSVTQPPRTELRTTDGALLAVIAEADVSVLEALDWPVPEPFVVPAADGVTELHGVLYRPFDFDPAHRYPVIDIIYNGPFITWAPKSFFDPVGQSAQRLAQLGFLVLVVDGRGTPGRGKAFQDVVFGNFGQHEIPDHAAALHALAARRPYMDLSRVGMFGGSWGGYMTLRALLTMPEVYHVGVVVNPVVDLYDHGATDIEGYMGLPEQRPEAYRRASNLDLVSQLRGKLLLMHSTNDLNATFSASVKLIDALIRADRHFELLVLPGQNHWPQGASNDYYQRRLRNFFARHLLAPNSSDNSSEASHAAAHPP